MYIIHTRLSGHFSKRTGSTGCSLNFPSSFTPRHCPLGVGPNYSYPPFDSPTKPDSSVRIIVLFQLERQLLERMPSNLAEQSKQVL